MDLSGKEPERLRNQQVRGSTPRASFFLLLNFQGIFNRRVAVVSPLTPVGANLVPKISGLVEPVNEPMRVVSWQPVSIPPQCRRGLRVPQLLPLEPQSRQVADLAHQCGREVILHLPTPARATVALTSRWTRVNCYGCAERGRGQTLPSLNRYSFRV